MTAQITIVGLGYGSLDAISQQTLAAINSIPIRFVRTSQHPTAHLVEPATSFDELYEKFDSFAEVYSAITAELIDAAKKHGSVLYAVPGSPLVLEQSVQFLLKDPSVNVILIPALSFLDVAWNELRIDPVDSSVRLVDGHKFAELAAGERGPLLVAQCHSQWVLSDIKLAHDSANGDEPVVILHHLGMPDQQIIHTTWDNIDRQIEPDHLTSLFIPQLAEPIGGEMAKLHSLARTLREQCPWDIEQTHQSLVQYLLEETYEVVDAINALDQNDPSTDDALIEELGDLLYQVEFHATIAEQQGRFNLADIARTIQNKLVRRHPHVFGDVTANSPQEVTKNWETIKQQERATTEKNSVFDGVAKAAPSLIYATKLQKRAAEYGFDWPDITGVLAKISEELDELNSAIDQPDDLKAINLELGDVLFSVVNLARHLGLDAEVALRSASEKFKSRFETVVALATTQGINLSDCSLTQLDVLWDQAKANSESLN